MVKVDIKDLEINDKVYYVAAHREVILKNAEAGYVTKILDGRVWVRYLGPQGNLTAVENLWK